MKPLRDYRFKQNVHNDALLIDAEIMGMGFAFAHQAFPDPSTYEARKRWIKTQGPEYEAKIVAEVKLIQDERNKRVICAWCDKTMKEGNGIVSHSICPDCKTKQDAELRTVRERRT